ncbi:MAG: transcriptional repressor [Gemmatimonadota bacterium]|nr:transcriptional repressor [Gemmatimonadota bacterium]
MKDERMVTTADPRIETRPPLGCAAVLMDVLRGELRERELPFTHQREVVARVLFESARHLSADDVAEELRRRGERIGKATIYRTLSLLVELGLLTEHDFGEGFRRYQMQIGAARHEHLICTVCGRVETFHRPELDRILEEAAAEAGFASITRQIKIFGTCHACS